MLRTARVNLSLQMNLGVHEREYSRHIYLYQPTRKVVKHEKEQMKSVMLSRNLDIHALSGLKRNDTKQLIRKISFKYYPIISEFLKDFFQKGF